MRKLRILIFCALAFAYGSDNLKPIELGKGNGPTLLLLGGIQGDEPGGFNATNIFLEHYKVKKGSVFVIPVLNFPSMLINSRGIYGDMNRKFSYLNPNDPEVKTIQKIKDYILDPRVDIVLNLHDGSGFYRTKYINKDRNPSKWGASSIIDQKSVERAKFQNLSDLSNQILKHINSNLISPDQRYYQRNTHTKDGDVEMEKALTYFAVRNNKAAIANEASKSLDLQTRVYYHLLAIEGLCHAIGIEFERDFNLHPKEIHRLINKNFDITIANSITMPINSLRPKLDYFPLPESYKEKVESIDINSASYIVGLSDRKSEIFLKYGNKLKTRLKPAFMPFGAVREDMQINVDGKIENLKVPSIIQVKNYFEIKPKDGVRTNVIGYVSSKNESGFRIYKKDIRERYSVDKQGKLYRVEFYDGKSFIGMVMVRFI